MTWYIICDIDKEVNQMLKKYREEERTQYRAILCHFVTLYCCMHFWYSPSHKGYSTNGKGSEMGSKSKMWKSFCLRKN